METAKAVKFSNEIRRLFFRGEFKIIASPLVAKLPGFAALRVSLVSPPKLDFDVNIKTVRRKRSRSSAVYGRCLTKP